MQIRRNENLLFPGIKSNTVNNKFFMMSNAIKQDVSATVTISKAGRERARMLDESSKKDDYMKNAESKIDKILDTIRDGGTLSKDEEELVNNELKNMSEKKYKDYKDLRLSTEDVLAELKENYLRRERLFFDMQEQLEVDANSQLDDFDTEKIMAYMQEKEYDEEIIEMVEEYAEDDDEENQKIDSEMDEEVGADEQEINVNVGDNPIDEMESEDGDFKQRAMNVIENIENKMNDVKEASDKARKKENEFARNLENDYNRIQQVLNSDEVSIEDKVKAYDRFESEAYTSARGREVQRIKKQFDAETLMMARIMFQGHNRIDNVIKGDIDRSQMGTEFIKSFLV